MPWYYAGPEAKPVGPVSLEELHGRRISGAIQPETYIIEDTGQPDPARAWRRYREVFPVNPNLPPIPTTALPPLSPPVAPPYPYPQAAALPVQAHPLFPSAAPVPSHAPPGHQPVFASPHGSDPYYAAHKTNSWCAWSLGLGLPSFLLILFCGVGTLMALASIFLGVGGLVQVQGHREQTGRAAAIIGILASLFTLVLTIAVVAYLAKTINTNMRWQSTTEQTSNDSE
ncbi:MAG TPA: hypothetical protein VL981_13365 [Candidatus Methylacidiphilales bacterium]|nr:hypothetical protein [Candidatus Methylacidiphilales bacterium]